MSAKWFDLMDYEAKLERLSPAPGHFTLRLEMPTSRLPESEPDKHIGDILMDMGWTVEAGDDKRVVLENHQPLNTATQIVGAIRTFFSEKEIAVSHKPFGEMRQGEQAEGIEPPKVISLKQLESSVHGVGAEDFERIAGSVAKAIANREEREKRADNVVFAGKGIALANLLIDTIAEKEGWSELDAAYVTYLNLDQAASRTSSGMATRMTQLGRAIANGEQGEIEAAKAWILEEMESAHGRVMANLGESGDVWASLRDKMRKQQGYTHIEHHLADDNTAARPRDVAAQKLMESSDSMTAAMMSGLPVSPDDSFEAVSQQVPFRVLRDNSVPTKTLVQNMKAVSKAIRYIASEMDMEPEGLFPGQTNVPARFSFDAVSANQNAVGAVRSFERKDGEGTKEKEGEADVRPMVLSLSVKKGGSFIHELGHLIDQGNGLTDDERHEILRGSGVLMKSREVLDRLYPDGGEMYDYYSSEKEIFARTFEAHFTNLARERGDDTLDSIGGWQVTYGADVAAPFGDLEASQRFMDMLKQTLDAKKEAKHSATMEQQAAPHAVEMSGSLSP